MQEHKDWIDRTFETERLSGPEGFVVWVGSCLLGASLASGTAALVLHHGCQPADTAPATAQQYATEIATEDGNCTPVKNLAIESMTITGISGIAAMASAGEASLVRRRIIYPD